jgi:hypothetical protein
MLLDCCTLHAAHAPYAYVRERERESGGGDASYTAPSAQAARSAQRASTTRAASSETVRAEELIESCYCYIAISISSIKKVVPQAAGPPRTGSPRARPAARPGAGYTSCVRVASSLPYRPLRSCLPARIPALMRRHSKLQIPKEPAQAACCRNRPRTRAGTCCEHLRKRAGARGPCTGHNQAQ